jgi:hypothetical protein
LPNLHPNETRVPSCFEASRCNQSIPVRETTFSTCSGTGRSDYKTDCRPAGRAWAPLDDPMSKSGYPRAIWTTQDDAGQRAACSTTAECRCDFCPACPREASIYLDCSDMACRLFFAHLTPIAPNGSTVPCSHTSMDAQNPRSAHKIPCLTSCSPRMGGQTIACQGTSVS